MLTIKTLVKKSSRKSLKAFVVSAVRVFLVNEDFRNWKC